MQYHREGNHPIKGIQPLVYVDLDPTQEEMTEEKSTKDDVGVTKAFVVWWQIELEEGDKEDQGCRVCQRVESIISTLSSPYIQEIIGQNASPSTK